MKFFLRSCFTAAVILLAQAAFAEIVYLKDGQVLSGKIVAENAGEIVIQTKYQKRSVKRDDVLRIMYGERKMEKVFLLMKDGTTRQGYKVDEDAAQVLIREKEDSSQEISVPKDKIKQISGSEIVPLEPSLYLRAGIFHVVNSEGGKFKPAAIFFAGSDINFQWIHNVRVQAEAGFCKADGSSSGFTGQFIPVHLNALYDFGFGSFHIVPKLSLGATVFDLNDGEGSSSRSFCFSTMPGIGFVYELVDRHLYAGLWADYLYMRDSASQFHCATGSFSLAYRF